MTHLIDKFTVVAEIKDLYEDIDKCIGDLVLARSKHDQRGISDAHWKMETLMVNTQQVLSYILQYLEVKEVDIEKEINKYISDNFFGSETMGFFAARTKEEPNDIDMALCAKHFYELGLSVSNKAEKGKEV